MELQKLIQSIETHVRENAESEELLHGEILYHGNNCQILSQSVQRNDFIVYNDQTETAAEISLLLDEQGVMLPLTDGDAQGWNRYAYACLLLLKDELKEPDRKVVEHKKYSREGMKKRVLKERQQRAEAAEYRVELADNIHGDHIVINENGVRYKVFLRDFEQETGYSDSPDAQVNKLGTTKHIMYVFNLLKKKKHLRRKLSHEYPFVEIFLDPLNDYRITWYYPHELQPEQQLLLNRFFKNSNFLPEEDVFGFIRFLEEAKAHDNFKVRPEVYDKVERAHEKRMLKQLQETQQLDFSPISANLYPYQKEGIEFAVFKKAAIIADEMGLGKTLQAIGTAVLKKHIFDFKHTLVVCPASLKSQWKREIEKFTGESAEIVQGTPDEREKRYRESESYFLIVNYETVLRDQVPINAADIDLLILDEAQRVKNYATQTARAIKNLDRKHILVITGTPIENKLLDIYSIMGILDPHFLGPLWEFSYKHCLFDTEKYNKINGYFNLGELKEQLSQILIRREKRDVLSQLPNVQQMDIAVGMTPLQRDYHVSYANGIAQIVNKKFLTQYDMQKMQLLLASMRMVCDSTYLIDETTNDSPKLQELKYMLLEKLDVKNRDTKIIIFSEWIKVHKLIGTILRENNIGFAELNGKIPVKHRGNLIKKFETDPKCKIFLSTEAGGAGLNLQVADTLINFELPWNPAKKNQRIGRIDRIGQKNSNLSIYNFITRQSIEERIALGLLVKQNLFEGVLDHASTTDFVDFSSKGSSQFIDQLREMLGTLDEDDESEMDERAEEEEKEASAQEEKQPENKTQQAETEQEKAPEEIVEQAESKSETQAEASEQKPDETAQQTDNRPKTKAKEMEQVLNSGLDFLSGIMKMSTGQDKAFEGKSIEVNEETGEVTMKFKLPGF